MTDSIIATMVSNKFMTLIKKGFLEVSYWQEQLDGYKTYEYFTNAIDLQRRITEINPWMANNERWVEYWLEHPANSTYAVSPTGGINFIDGYRYFDPNDGILLAWEDGNFEVIRNDLTYKLIFTRYYYAEERIELVLTTEQIKGIHAKGLSSLHKLVAELKLQHWEYRPIWIVFAQCKILSGMCSMAYDDSEYHITYYFIPAYTAEEALEKATAHIEDDFMSIMQVYEVKLFDKTQYPDDSDDAMEIIDNAKQAYAKQEIRSSGITPGCIHSLLTTPHFAIISLGHFEAQYWSSRIAQIQHCEWFMDKSHLFNRLVTLGYISQEERNTVLDDYKQIDEDASAIHLRILSAGTRPRFEKIQRNFPENAGLLIDWNDWDYDFVREGDRYHLYVYLGGITDPSRDIFLNEQQVAQYHQEGIVFIHQLIQKLKRREL